MRRTAPGVLSVVVGVVFGLVGCKNSPTAFDEFKKDPQLARIAAMPDDTTKLRLLGAYVRNFIGDPICTGPDQCRVMPFGDKPCGGPWTYLVYSTETTDSAALDVLVGEYNRLDSLMNVKYGRRSDCMFVLPPNVGCVDGRCERIGR